MCDGGEVMSVYSKIEKLMGWGRSKNYNMMIMSDPYRGVLMIEKNGIHIDVLMEKVNQMDLGDIAFLIDREYNKKVKPVRNRLNVEFNECGEFIEIKKYHENDFSFSFFYRYEGLHVNHVKREQMVELWRKIGELLEGEEGTIKG